MNYTRTIIRLFKYELIKVISFLLVFSLIFVYVMNETNKSYETSRNNRITHKEAGYRKVQENANNYKILSSLSKNTIRF